MGPRGSRGQHSMGPRGSRGQHSTGPRGSRGLEKNIKEIFFKISEKKYFIIFSLLKISSFFRENLIHFGCVC